MQRELPPEAPGFMPRRIGLSNIPSSYAFRALKKETEKLALDEIWSEKDLNAKTDGKLEIEDFKPTKKS